MKNTNFDAVFLPKHSKQEAKADATNRQVREILAAEARKRDSKTERLRAARLANEAGRSSVTLKNTRGVTRRVK